MKKILFFIVLLLIAGNGTASYTANYISKVAWVKIYNNDVIYFGLELMPTDHLCSGTFFALSPTITEKQRDRYYAMLLAARTSKLPITVGYDNRNPDCFSTRPIVYSINF